MVHPSNSFYQRSADSLSIKHFSGCYKCVNKLQSFEIVDSDSLFCFVVVVVVVVVVFSSLMFVLVERPTPEAAIVFDILCCHFYCFFKVNHRFGI